ncbi:hypothetical protein UF75_1693 [Desulfosporosinus sp. I2]|nr:hypothetical protein UF75_1693 [Desulfosporosinus sp. I2]
MHCGHALAKSYTQVCIDCGQINYKVLTNYLQKTLDNSIIATQY